MELYLRRPAEAVLFSGRVPGPFFLKKFLKIDTHTYISRTVWP